MEKNYCECLNIFYFAFCVPGGGGTHWYLYTYSLTLHWKMLILAPSQWNLFTYTTHIHILWYAGKNERTVVNLINQPPTYVEKKSISHSLLACSLFAHLWRSSPGCENVSFSFENFFILKAWMCVCVCTSCCFLFSFFAIFLLHFITALTPFRSLCFSVESGWHTQTLCIAPHNKTHYEKYLMCHVSCLRIKRKKKVLATCYMCAMCMSECVCLFLSPWCHLIDNLYLLCICCALSLSLSLSHTDTHAQNRWTQRRSGK